MNAINCEAGPTLARSARPLHGEGFNLVGFAQAKMYARITGAKITAIGMRVTPEPYAVAQDADARA